MIIKNATKYPEDRVRELLQFGGKGVRDAGVEIHVKNATNKPFRGLAYSGVPEIANTDSRSRYLITIGIGGPEWFPLLRKTKLTKNLQKSYPDGVPLETWEDVLVYIAAHEIRHIWQYQRLKKTGKGGKGEHDADQFAINRLNKFREETGRSPIERVKLENPFKNNGRETAVKEIGIMEEVKEVEVLEEGPAPYDRKNKRERRDSIHDLAYELVKVRPFTREDKDLIRETMLAHGIEEEAAVDFLRAKGDIPETEPDNGREVMSALVEAFGCTRETARRHLKEAAKRKQYPNGYEPPPWGGSRGGGRPPKNPGEISSNEEV